VGACKKKRWNMTVQKAAIAELLVSDEEQLSRRYKDHVLVGSWLGYRAVHVDSAPNPAKDQWVLMYKLSGNELVLVRTGAHEEVYGK